MSGLRRVSLAPVSDSSLNRRGSLGGGSSRASIGFNSKSGRDSIGVSNRRSSVGGSRYVIRLIFIGIVYISPPILIVFLDIL